MNVAAAFGQALASLSYAGRNPSWREYAEGSPAERRAILSRWNEIRFERGNASEEGKAAFENYCRAVTAPDFVPDIQPYRPAVAVEYESAQERWDRGEYPIGPNNQDDEGL
jgi:hypothetical protein